MGITTRPCTNLAVCFPWGIYEAKRFNTRGKISIEKSMVENVYFQAANAASTCVAMLAQLPTTDIKPIVAFTNVGQEWSLLICTIDLQKGGKRKYVRLGLVLFHQYYRLLYSR